MIQDVDIFFSQEKNICLSLVTFLAKDDPLYDDIKLGVSNILLKKVNSNEFEKQLSQKEREFFVKNIVKALIDNEGPNIRQNITQVIANILLPEWAFEQEKKIQVKNDILLLELIDD